TTATPPASQARRSGVPDAQGWHVRDAACGAETSGPLGLRRSRGGADGRGRRGGRGRRLGRGRRGRRVAARGGRGGGAGRRVGGGVVVGAGGGGVVGGVTALSTRGAGTTMTAATFFSASFFSSGGTLARSVCRRRAVAWAFGASCALTASFSSLMWWLVSSRA